MRFTMYGRISSRRKNLKSAKKHTHTNETAAAGKSDRLPFRHRHANNAVSGYTIYEKTNLEDAFTKYLAGQMVEQEQS